jgi:hypothetical protein
MQHLLTLSLRSAFVAVLLLVAGLQNTWAQSPRVVVAEDFEGYTNSESLRATWTGGSAEFAPAPGGGNAALHDGGNLNSRGGFSIRPNASSSVLFSADIYDEATHDELRLTVQLRNGSGANLEFGYIYEQHPFAFRIVGFAEPTAWSSFDAELQRRPGWNRFQAILSMTNTILSVDMGADGTIEKVLAITGPPPTRPFNAIRFGGIEGRKSHDGPMFVDNIKLSMIPASDPVPVVTAPAQTAQPVTTAVTAPPVATNTLPAPAPIPAVQAQTTEPTPSTPTPPTQAAGTPVTPAASGMGTALWGIVGALAVIIILLGALLLALKKENSAAPATVPSTIPDMVKNPALAELTEFAKQSLVQGLYSQRQALIETQKKAQEELAELESKLGQLQLPLQDRIRAYEKRIEELEKQLESRDEEMHEITRITLQLVREKLEEEKERAGGQFN